MMKFYSPALAVLTLYPPLTSRNLFELEIRGQFWGFYRWSSRNIFYYGSNYSQQQHLFFELGSSWWFCCCLCSPSWNVLLWPLPTGLTVIYLHPHFWDLSNHSNCGIVELDHFHISEYLVLRYCLELFCCLFGRRSYGDSRCTASSDPSSHKGLKTA